jgi:tRNA-2-methylthio-N6-dimethylallyladenosine synthase
MNVSDSELITSILLSAEFQAVDSIDDADVIIFNTCSVRQHAEDRVLGRISNEKKRKTTNPKLKIGVVGCMAQRIGQDLVTNNAGIDFAVGVDQYAKLPEIIMSKYGGNVSLDMDSSEVYSHLQPVHKNDTCGFVTIMRGCDNFCTYCIVPYVRGRERSRPAEDIYLDVKNAATAGLKDITLLGQNVNSYNYQDITFAGLMKEISQIDSIERLRFITSHPKDLSDELIEVMASSSKICKHIHLPMQSGDNDVLRIMNRKYTVDHYMGLISKLRAAMPEIAITTDLIAGFPGETDDMFHNTLSVMNEIVFDYSFCFKYSNRSGTKASDFADQVPEEVRLMRLQKMIDLQRIHTLAKFRAQIGKQVSIYVESLSKKSTDQVSGKTEDYKIAVVDGKPDQIGTLVRAIVTDATSGTLICRPI